MPAPLLLLPGMMCDGRLWRHQIRALDDRVTTLVGDITRGDRVVDIAANVLASAPARFALAGLSMGGIVALEMWRQAPERIERLALLDTNYLADPPQRRALRERQLQAVKSGALFEVLRDELKPNYLAAVHRDNSELLAEVLAMGMDLGAAVFVSQSLALRDRPESESTLATITCPTLLLCGDEDTLCPVDIHRAMAAEIPDAELVVVTHCGHLSTLEQPDAVTHALARWLAAA